jgi:hypothetical protein
MCFKCSKSGDIIEPILKPQWWINCQPMAQEAIKVRFVFFKCVNMLTLTAANERRQAHHQSQIVRKRMVPMAGGDPGLVYISSALVGSPVSGLSCQDRGRGSRRKLRLFTFGTLKDPMICLAQGRQELGCRTHPRGSDRTGWEDRWWKEVHSGTR